MDTQARAGSTRSLSPPKRRKGSTSTRSSSCERGTGVPLLAAPEDAGSTALSSQLGQQADTSSHSAIHDLHHSGGAAEDAEECGGPHRDAWVARLHARSAALSSHQGLEALSLQRWDEESDVCEALLHYDPSLKNRLEQLTLTAEGGVAVDLCGGSLAIIEVGCPNLKGLIIKGEQLSLHGSLFRALQSLDLIQLTIDVQTVDDDVLRSLSSLPHLWFVEITIEHFSDVQLGILSRLPLPRLTWLHARSGDGEAPQRVPLTRAAPAQRAPGYFGGSGAPASQAQSTAEPPAPQVEDPCGAEYRQSPARAAWWAKVAPGTGCNRGRPIGQRPAGGG